MVMLLHHLRGAGDQIISGNRAAGSLWVERVCSSYATRSWQSWCDAGMGLGSTHLRAGGSEPWNLRFLEREVLGHADSPC